MNVATSSLFSQLLSLVDRNRFAKLVRETGSERRSKGFASWDHFVAMLLLKLLQFRSRIDWSFSNLVASLRWNLFTHKNLWQWIDEPFLPPPEPPPDALFQPDLDGILPVRNC